MVSRRNFIIGSGVVALGSTLLGNAAPGLAQAAMPGPDWLPNSVLYLLYPQSFSDSNGDGRGDIPGITNHMEYLSELGVNLIWIPPIYPSPFDDAGYDVTDYKDVNEKYGTLADFDELMGKAKDLEIKILLDLVAGHTSLKHPWFIESSKKDSDPSRYIWASPDQIDMNKLSGHYHDLPKDWPDRSGTRPGRYMVNYDWAQPALNYGFARPNDDEPWRQSVDDEAPRATRAAMKDVMDFWLKRGVSGFRCDMAFSLVKDDEGQKETAKVWQDIRGWLDEKHPNTMLISEWGNPPKSIPAGFNADFFLHDLEDHRDPDPDSGGVWKSLYDHRYTPYFSDDGRGSAQHLVEKWKEYNDKIGSRGYIALPTGNFDDGDRLNNGYRDTRALKSGFVLQLTWPTLPMIYQGEEIGMKMIKDAEEVEGSGVRSRNRTPMQWDSTKNAGFSEADKLWLDIDPDPNRPTVEAQKNDDNSLWKLVQRLITLRKKEKELQPGADVKVFATGYPFTYLRGDRFLVAVNPRAAESDEVEIDDDRLGGARPVDVQGAHINGNKLQLDGFGYAIYDLRP